MTKRTREREHYLLRSRRNVVDIDAVALALAHFSGLGGESLSRGELERGRELPGEAVLLLMVQPLPLLPTMDLLDEAHFVRLRLHATARKVQFVLEEGRRRRRRRLRLDGGFGPATLLEVVVAGRAFLDSLGR